MTIVDGCYDNLSRLLWRYVAVAMEIDGGCYGNKVWLCTYTLWLCRYVVLTLIGVMIVLRPQEGDAYTRLFRSS